MPDSSVAERLAALGDRFRAGLPAQAAALRDAVAAGDTAAVASLAHCLAGRGGTFGYPELSRVAAALEAAVTGGNADAVHRRARELDAVVAVVARA